MYVNRAVFTDNSYGISINAVNRATVLSSEFYLGFNAAEGEECDGKSAAYGIDMTECTGFAIEENKFFKAVGAPLGNYIGVRTKDCQTTSTLYLNEYSGISIGNIAEGNNRPLSSNNGVTYFCNQNAENNYDFYVSGEESTVSGFIGWYDNPSGNKLSSDATVQFQNDNIYSSIIYFFNENEPDEVLSNYSQGVFIYPLNDENTCPSHYGGGGSGGRITLTEGEKLAKEAEYYQAYNDYNSVESLYYSLVDGGNTEALKTDVELSWPQDMWELRAELLGKSPHLSQEVLITAADKTDVLPESVLFEILSANPDELKKEELMAYLEDKENPLPQYMINILRQLANGFSYKAVLQSEMAKHHASKVWAAQDIIRSILSEESPDLTALRNWLDNIGGLESDKQIVSTYIQEGDYTSAEDLLAMIPSLYQLTGEELSAFNDYKSVQEILIDMEQENRTIYDLTSQEQDIVTNLANNGLGTAKTIAQGMLQYAYGEVYCNCPGLPENIQLKSTSTEIDKDNFAKAMGLEISVDPNPAGEWTAIDYSLPLSESIGIIEITDNMGRSIQQIKLDLQKGQHVLDTRSYTPGVYYYTIRSGELQRSGKLIIQ